MQEGGHVLAHDRAHSAELGPGASHVPAARDAGLGQPADLGVVRGRGVNVGEGGLGRRLEGRRAGQAVEEGGHVLALDTVHSAELGLGAAHVPTTGYARGGQPADLPVVRGGGVNVGEGGLGRCLEGRRAGQAGSVGNVGVTASLL